MPFGRIFGAMFFFLCSWIGLQFLSSPSTPANVAGGCLILAGISLGLALLSRSGWARWARWVGVVAATGLAGLGLQMTLSGGSTADLLMLFAALATAVLLAIPATGGATARPEPSAAGGSGLPGKLLLATSVLGLVGLMASGVWGYRSREVTPPTV
ncbi:MAG: hypothetical protein GWM90_14975, partial [Gemmatimonadetes bacterium]|nr:hypothetical protein [Gemmatimonadota bacterium]NIX45359.1 hypothetical protein [Gemmatimonadota bacterium]